MSNSMILLLMKTFVVEMFNNLCNITVADVHMKSTDLMYKKSKIPFSYMLCLFCKRAYRGTKPEESFG